MLTSRIMVKRTTVSAEEDDLAILEREAKRRGVSLSLMLREAVAEYAAEVRQANKPRFGYASGPSNLAQESADDEDAPYAYLAAEMDDHE